MPDLELQKCASVEDLIDRLVNRRRATPRKIVLFCAACCRRLWPLLPDESARAVIEMLEEVDTPISPQAFMAAVRSFASSTGLDDGPNPPGHLLPEEAAILAVRAACSATAPASRYAGFVHTASYALRALCDGCAIPPTRDVRQVETAAQCLLLRDIFGNSSGAVAVSPDWLRWNGGAIPTMAAAIYAKRLFEDLPILADALEEAGCTDRRILGHCRGRGPHVRGCWVLDLLLDNG
jgi:hypothetical protein